MHAQEFRRQSRGLMGEAVSRLEMPPSPLLTDSKKHRDPASTDRGTREGAGGGCVCLCLFILLMLEENPAAFSYFGALKEGSPSLSFFCYPAKCKLVYIVKNKAL